MVYVNERIPDNRSVTGTSLVTINKEQGVMLQYFPGMPESSERLELTFNQRTLKIDVTLCNPALGKTKKDIAWKVLRIFTYKEFGMGNEQIIKVLTEALDVYGEYGKRDRVNSVTVDFTQAYWGC